MEGGLVGGAKLIVNENALTAEDDDSNEGADMMDNGDQDNTGQSNKDLLKSSGKLLVLFVNNIIFNLSLNITSYFVTIQALC